jgi:2-keto-4-pentenoate hydratase
MDAAATASLLDDAHRAGVLLRADDVEIRDVSFGYEVQDALSGLRTSRGARPVGWKLGYTSAVMRAQMGVAEPNFGPLLSTMLLEGVVGRGLLQPRVEPEIALVVLRHPDGGADLDGVLACCSVARTALEVVDSVWEGYRFDLAHNTADGSSAAGVVLGDELPLERLDEVGVTLMVDDEVVGSGLGADALGHPAAGLAWLAARLAERGAYLRPGDIVITGGLTAAHALAAGSRAGARFVHPDAGVRQVAVAREGVTA